MHSKEHIYAKGKCVQNKEGTMEISREILKTVRDTDLVKWKKSCIITTLIKLYLEYVVFLVFEIF